MSGGQCPTCGADLHDEVSWNAETRTFLVDGQTVRFTKTQGLIFDALWRARKRGGIQEREQFMQAAYADDIDGGPECSSTLSVHLWRIRKMLEPTPYTVSMNFGRPRGGWNIQRAVQ
jgi:DNA-binding response OmpR family regulator